MKCSTICYIEKDDKYLLLHRTKKENDINKDKWIGVGGKIEECIIREVKEETGLTITSYKLRCLITYTSNDWETEYMYVFTSNSFEGELIECDEGDLAWIYKKDVEKLNRWEGDKIFMDKIENNDNFFTAKLEYNGDKLLKYTIKQY